METNNTEEKIKVTKDWPWYKVQWGEDRKGYNNTKDLAHTANAEATIALNVPRNHIFVPRSERCVYFSMKCCADEMQAFAYYTQIKHLLDEIDA